MADNTGAQAIQANQERVTKQFMDLVQIDSPTFEELAVLEYLAAQLKELGVESYNDGSGKNGAGNLIATVKGTDPGAQPIIICTHMDTVEPGRGIKPSITDGVIHSDGATILAADDKAAVASTLEAVRLLLEHKPAHGDLELIFTWGEERGLFGSRALDVSKLRSRVAFIADGGEPIGTVVTQAPWQNTIGVTFTGKAAHAGVEPEKGISAIVAASKAIAAMPLGRIDSETTANVGKISGGSARNAVPETVTLDAEARSRNQQKLADQTEAMRRCLEEGAAAVGASVKIEINRSYNGFKVAEDSGLVQVAFSAARNLGLPPRATTTGGGSDANNFNEKGLPSIILGCSWYDVHSTRERVPVASLVTLSRYLVEIATEAARQFRG